MGGVGECRRGSVWVTCGLKRATGRAGVFGEARGTIIRGSARVCRKRVVMESGWVEVVHLELSKRSGDRSRMRDCCGAAVQLVPSLNDMPRHRTPRYNTTLAALGQPECARHESVTTLQKLFAAAASLFAAAQPGNCGNALRSLRFCRPKVVR
ncbi:hypothetical protein K458DRAFT_127850 [Lentithecium fluviatile CBS 122367]|uniref:Uncharacterized protein n=1 Tax=Lentithecium fluviatile CBS 122367 TaxID=1168545 RepID=A0A6G1JG82_9PLEO|nr:hypothetical protein K458DRAFT_127850 [Lentithecium fluviatile CBS 122367]